MRLKDWRAKAYLQRAFSVAPGGQHLNYLMQRAVGGLPLGDAQLRSHIETGRQHIDGLTRQGVDPTISMGFEFGAGFDLHMPLIQHALGLREQVLYDLRRLARSRLVFDVAERLDAWPARPDEWPKLYVDASLSDLLRANGLSYEAPGDAANTSLPDGSIDVVITSSTLEHIPPDELSAIYTECHRILREGGVMSMCIDYSDHWSHFDRSLTPYNFLRFTPADWQKWTPAFMYQSRLRHSDHLSLFQQTGFDVVEAEVAGNDEAGLRALASVPLAPQFADRDPADLAITRARVVLKRTG